MNIIRRFGHAGRGMTPVAYRALLAPFALVLILLSGCASHIQRSIDQALLVEQRCDAVLDAMPVNADDQGALADAIVNAVAIRIAGSCALGGTDCLGSKDMARTLASTARKATRDVANHLSALRTLSSDRSKMFDLSGATAAETSIEQIGVDLERLITRRAAQEDSFNYAYAGVIKTLTSLKEKLQARGAALTVASANSPSRVMCGRRSECVSELARQVASMQDGFDNLSVSFALALQTAIDDVNADIVTLTRIKEASGSLSTARLRWSTGFLTELEETARALQEARLALEALARNAVIGKAALAKLLAGDVESAVQDFTAGRIYRKAAEHAIVAIDDMLAPVDRLVDKIDDKYYVGASLVSMASSGEIEQWMDRIYVKAILPRFPSNTAKINFAAAACQQLKNDETSSLRRPSLFRPFLLSMMTNLDYDLSTGIDVSSEPRKSTPVELPDARAAKLKTMREKQKNDKESVNAADAESFARSLSQALAVDSDPTHHDGPKAPSMVQQVAVCGDLQQRLTLFAPANASRTSAIDTCGQTILNASAIRTTLPATPPAAVSGAESALRHTHDDKPLAALDLAAVTNALQTAFKAGVDSIQPREPARYADLCARIEARVRGAACIPSTTNAVVDLPQRFASGKSHDVALAGSLATLADLLEGLQAARTVLVNGFASSAGYPCKEGEAKNCGQQRNFALSQDRADWAKAILQRRAGSVLTLKSAGQGAGTALDADSMIDRRLRLVLCDTRAKDCAF